MLESILAALSPVAEAFLEQTAKNIAEHQDPEAAAELAALVTSSRLGSIAIINAVLKFRRKMKART